MIFKISFVSFLILISACTLQAQALSSEQEKDSLNNQFSMEIFGNGITYSFNYERLLIRWRNLNVASRSGFGYYPYNNQVLSLPLEINAFWGQYREFAEAGLGVTFYRMEPNLELAQHGLYSRIPRVSPENQILLAFRFGYRYQEPNKRSSFRVGLVLFFDPSEGNFKPLNPQIPLGFSYGYRF